MFPHSYLPFLQNQLISINVQVRALIVVKVLDATILLASQYKFVKPEVSKFAAFTYPEEIILMHRQLSCADTITLSS